MPAPRSSAVNFFHELPVSLKERTRLKRFIESIFRKEAHVVESLNYVFCTDKRLLEINKQYLRHDYYTDIITFELSIPGQRVNGEIYISIDRVRDNAQNLDETFQRELHRVIFHGALHLCGYRDKTQKEQARMREREDHYLTAYFR